MCSADTAHSVSCVWSLNASCLPQHAMMYIKYVEPLGVDGSRVQRHYLASSSDVQDLRV